MSLDSITLTDDNGGGYTYYKLRDLGTALGFEVDWTSETGITVDTPAAEPVVITGDYDEELFEKIYYTLPWRRTEPAPFNGTVTELELTEEEAAFVAEYEGVTMRKRVVDGIAMCEAFIDDGEEKPVVVCIFHSKSSFTTSPDASLASFAAQGLYAISFDMSGFGDSDRDVLVRPQDFAEAVRYIDTLLEYSATTGQADPMNTALVGGSIGAAVTYSYVAHGKYTPTAAFAQIGNPNLEVAMELAAEKGNLEPGSWTEEQVMEFAKAYSAHQYPERFLDTYLYVGNGGLEDSEVLDAVKALEEDLTELGGTKFEFYIDPERGHERLPVFFENMLTRIPETLLGSN